MSSSLGPDGPERDVAARLDGHALLQLAGVGADGEPAFALAVERGHRDLAAQGEHALAVGVERVDVDGGDLGHVHDELGDLDQGQADVVDVRRRMGRACP